MKTVSFAMNNLKARADNPPTRLRKKRDTRRFINSFEVPNLDDFRFDDLQWQRACLKFIPANKQAAVKVRLLAATKCFLQTPLHYGTSITATRLLERTRLLAASTNNLRKEILKVPKSKARRVLEKNDPTSATCILLRFGNELEQFHRRTTEFMEEINHNTDLDPSETLWHVWIALVFRVLHSMEIETKHRRRKQLSSGVVELINFLQRSVETFIQSNTKIQNDGKVFRPKRSDNLRKSIIVARKIERAGLDEKTLIRFLSNVGFGLNRNFARQKKGVDAEEFSLFFLNAHVHSRIRE